MFAGDPERLSDALATGRREHIRAMGQALREKYLPAVTAQVVVLKAWRDEVRALAEVLEAQKAAKPLTEAQRRVLARYEVGGFGKRVPNGSPIHDADVARHGVADAAARNTNDGSIAAAQAMQAEAEAEIAAVDKAVLELKETVVPTVQMGDLETLLPVRPAGGDRAAVNLGPLGQYAAPPEVPGGSKLAQANRALEAGEAEAAEKLYREVLSEARAAAKAGRPMTRGEYPIEVLEQKLLVASRLGTLRPAPAAKPAALLREIDDAELAQALKLPRKSLGDATGGAERPGISAIQVAGDNQYAIKQLGFGPNQMFKTYDDLAEALVEGEVVGAELARLLGVQTPAVRLVVDRAGGRVTIVSRWAPGTRLDNVAPEAAHAAGRQLTEHRTFGVWIGNYDGKPDNFKVGPTGVVSLDLATANLRGGLERRVGRFFGDEDFFTGNMGRDHWAARAYYDLTDAASAAQLAAKPGVRAAAVRTLLLESALDASHARDLIARVRRLTAGDAVELKAALTRGYGQVYADEATVAACVEQALQRLRKNAAGLESAAAEWNRRNGLPLSAISPGSTLSPGSRRGARPTFNPLKQVA